MLLKIETDRMPRQAGRLQHDDDFRIVAGAVASATEQFVKLCRRCAKRHLLDDIAIRGWVQDCCLVGCRYCQVNPDDACAHSDTSYSIHARLFDWRPQAAFCPGTSMQPSLVPYSGPVGDSPNVPNRVFWAGPNDHLRAEAAFAPQTQSVAASDACFQYPPIPGNSLIQVVNVPIQYTRRKGVKGHEAMRGRASQPWRGVAWSARKPPLCGFVPSCEARF